jgi:hypothetical protein
MPSNSPDYISTNRVTAALPLSARTAERNTNSPSFHIIKLPALTGNVDRLQRLVVEFCIQPLGTASRQAIWWTSYVVIARSGALKTGSGVYTEWNQFGTLGSQSAIGIIAPWTDGNFSILDISKGVLNGNHTNGTVLRVVDLSERQGNIDVFAVLVASGMHDGAYQVHGQATLDFRLKVA